MPFSKSYNSFHKQKVLHNHVPDFYRYWLMIERGMNDIEADMGATKTFDYIRKKIADMKTVPHGKLLQHYVQYSDPYFFNTIYFTL